MVIALNEMALSKSDAIDRCISLGNRFIEHFLKVIKEGKTHQDFLHHCQEMQAWYDSVRKIKLKLTNKALTKTNLIDWFFTAGQVPEDFMDEDLVEIYETFYLRLLSLDKKVVDILRDLL